MAERPGEGARRGFSIGLNAVIVAVTEERPRILTVDDPQHPADHGAPAEHRQPGLEALPFGPLEPDSDRTLELALRGWVREQTGLQLGYTEQLYTFGDRDRGFTGSEGSPRVISIGYLALVREVRPAPRARWRDWYDLFPWEDRRSGAPSVIEERVLPGLEAWIERGETSSVRALRRERADIAFGRRGARWDTERVLERFELLYEAGLVQEAQRDLRRRQSGRDAEAATAELPELGRPLILDHRRILATGLGRLRGKVKYRPLVFELLPETFTLLELQRTVEALAGVRLHKGNFRRLVERGGLVEGTSRLRRATGGRPAELFRFRRDVLRERRAPGVGLPEDRVEE